MFSASILNPFKSKRGVEAEAFRDGTQGASSDGATKELTAHFEKEKEKRRHAAATPIRSLEGRIDSLKGRAADAESLWRKHEADTGGVPPQIALPLLAVLSAVIVVIGEGSFLAPVMDGLGIADPLQQYLLAVVLVLVSSGLLKVALHQLRTDNTGVAETSNLALPPGAPVEQTDAGQREQGIPQAEISRKDDSNRRCQGNNPIHKPGYARSFRLIAAGLLSVFALALVFVLGWWRAEELIYAGSVEQGELGSFLSQNPTLTRVVITLLTVGLPIFAAIAFEWGFDRLHAAWQWRKARRAHLNYSRQLNSAQKQLEAKIQQLDHHTAALDEQRKEWEGSYLQNHELGRMVGAHKQPLWQVVFKIIAVLFIILLVCYLVIDPLLAVVVPIGLLRLLIYVVGFGGLYAYHALKSWDRPSPKQLYGHRRTIWRNEMSKATPEAPISADRHAHPNEESSAAKQDAAAGPRAA